MLLERNFYNTDGEQVGVYFIDPESDREVYDIYGNLIDYSKMPPEFQNFIDNELDSFEDGFNKVEDGYEVSGTIGLTTITIKRKIERVEYFK